MAEIILHISTAGKRGGIEYGDGDILVANNDRYILSSHTQKICHVKKMARNTNGFLAVNNLAWHHQIHTYKYKFTRISKTEIRRDELGTLNTEIFSNIPNAKGEQMDVPLFIERRIRHTRNRMFGDFVSATWFGGRVNSSQAKLDLVWDEIESQTSLLRANHKALIVPTHELKKRLYLKCVNFTDAEANVLTESEYDDTDPDNLILINKRKNYVDFDLVTELASRSSDIYNKNTVVNVRSLKLFDITTIKIIKAGR